MSNKDKKGPVVSQNLDKNWQELAKRAGYLVEAAKAYLVEEKTNDMSAAFAAVRKYHAEYKGQMNDFETRR